ncbi:MAG: MFS transporter [Candidatus Lokiarchaeota archaeon]|nr:MFS transporter [Candidatus Lokiarchaeota archaeon]MBD3339515.1 MFS transporter [Candidatus Lokiarchaeota archaeon]
METKESKMVHSKKVMASYGTGILGREFVQMAFNVFVFFYYEVEIGLNVWLIGLGLVLFAIYNAINDPLIGYLTNRPFSFTKKWGRRLPWILMGGIPLGFSYFLVFTPPLVDPVSGAWILFGWLVLTTCLFDTFHSLFMVNVQSVFPDKFRSVDERRTATGFQILLGVVGTALGAMLPPLFITFGDLSSYVFQGIIVLVITLVAILLGIPGYREDQKTIDSYLASAEKQVKRESFIKSAKRAFKQRSFIAYIFLFTMYWVIINSLQASIPYVVRYVLNMPASATTLIMAAFLLGVVVSIPFWVKLVKKVNDNRKIMFLTATLMGVFISPLIFLKDYYLIMIATFVWGTAQGGYWAMIFPVFSDVIDESVALHEKREEGTYIGIQQFFGRLGLIIQVMSFSIIHSLTGFREGSDTQSAQAIWGIHMHLALVPMICILLGALVFWKWYDLRPEKIEENQLKIRELKL